MIQITLNSIVCYYIFDSKTFGVDLELPNMYVSNTYVFVYILKIKVNNHLIKLIPESSISKVCIKITTPNSLIYFIN